jgi:N-acetylglucosaminyl-diphospho-decaprenol L-rhamnosyltransferase
MPRISVLIINWNSWPDLRRCLESLAAADPADFGIVVIDNGSTDGSCERLRASFPRVRVHGNPRNLGHTRAVNQGFGLLDSDFVLLLDADTEIDRASVERLRRFMLERPDVALVAPRTFNTDGSVQETARNFPSFMSVLFGRQCVLTRLFPDNPFSRRYLMRDKLDATEPFRVEWVSAACMFLRLPVVAECGPWDEGYAGYWVDADWCLRLGQRGKAIYCVPQARVVHHENNHAGKKKSPGRIWMFHRGAARLYRKHYTAGWLDPRTWVASTGLAMRAAFLILGNHFKAGPHALVSAPRVELGNALSRENVS